MSLGRTLKALRQKKSLNQKTLSVLSGVSQATISRIETGRVLQLRSSALKSLAGALSVSVDFLMGDNEVFATIPTAISIGSIPGLPGGREDRFVALSEIEGRKQHLDHAPAETPERRRDLPRVCLEFAP